jgi:putative FmdB family regulatory protein
MPLYEYKCETCDAVFEVMQKFSDEPLASHDGCGGRVERLLSSPALQFKGSGWYITDYARAGKKDGATSPGKAESKSEAKPESKSESKPAGSEKK